MMADGQGTIVDSTKILVNALLTASAKPNLKLKILTIPDPEYESRGFNGDTETMYRDSQYEALRETRGRFTVNIESYTDADIEERENDS